MQQTTPLSPERMTSDQRIFEVANILAKGIIRLRESISNNPPLLDSDGDISLAMSAYRSVHGQPENANPKEAE